MAEQFALPVSLLVLIPSLLQQLGPDGFGLFGVALTVISMSALFSIGASSITARNVSLCVEKNDNAGAISAVRSAIGVVLLFGGSIAALAVISVPTISKHFLQRMGTDNTTSAALLVGLVCALLQEFDTVFSMALKGRDRFRLAATIEWVGRFLWATTILAAAAFSGLIATLVATVASLAVKAIVKGAATALVFHSSAVVVPSFDLARQGRLVSASRWLWFQNLSGLLALAADRLVVGSLFGSASMGVYTACAQLGQFAMLVPATAGQALLPWATKHVVAGTSPSRGWKVTLVYLGFVCLVPGITMGLLSAQALSVWLGPSFSENNWPTLVALSVSGASLAFFVPYHYALLAAGRVRLIGWANICGGLVCLATYFVAAPWGITAFAAARASYALPLMCYVFVQLLPMAAPRSSTK